MLVFCCLFLISFSLTLLLLFFFLLFVVVVVVVVIPVLLLFVVVVYVLLLLLLLFSCFSPLFCSFFASPQFLRDGGLKKETLPVEDT